MDEHGSALAALVLWVGTTAASGVSMLILAATTDLAGIALVIAAVGSLVTAVGGAVVAIMALRVHRAIDTGNEQQVGELAAATETRRVKKIPRAERTKQEQRHVDAAPPADPPQGPGR